MKQMGSRGSEQMAKSVAASALGSALGSIVGQYGTSTNATNGMKQMGSRGSEQMAKSVAASALGSVLGSIVGSTMATRMLQGRNLSSGGPASGGDDNPCRKELNFFLALTKNAADDEAFAMTRKAADALVRCTEQHKQYFNSLNSPEY